MKETGKCPKCSSSEVIQIPPKYGERMTLKLPVLKMIGIEMYVCKSCGYVEEYVESEESLKKLVETVEE